MVQDQPSIELPNNVFDRLQAFATCSTIASTSVVPHWFLCLDIPWRWHSAKVAAATVALEAPSRIQHLLLLVAMPLFLVASCS